MTEFKEIASEKLKLGLIIFLSVTLASCASIGGREENKKARLLNESVDAFNSSFRWEDYKEASSFVSPNKKELFWTEVDKFKGKIRLSDYQIREVNYEKGCPSATAIVYFQYWRPDDPTLQTVTFSQTWYYSEKQEMWKVGDSGFGAILKNRVGF